MRKRSRPSLEDDSLEEPLINLTPLIDVVFVVLISFMLIAPILDVDSVDLASSGASAKKESVETQNSPISISVRADNSIWFQGKQIPLAQLDSILKTEKKRHPKAIPQLIHDSRAHFGTYQSIKNTFEAAGFEQMDVILKPN